MEKYGFSIVLHVFVISIFSFVSLTKAQELNVTQVESQLLKKATENIEKYRKADTVITFINKSGVGVRDAEVKITQTTHDFLFGALIFDLVYFWEGAEYPPYRPDIFKKRFEELFNFAIFPFYWNHYEPTQAMPLWEKMLPVIEWCKLKDITTKGHPLVWTNRDANPEWFLELPFELSQELLKARVINTVRGFKGKIDIWDVVNESVNMRTWQTAWRDPDAEQYTTKESIQNIADYVEKSFKWAYMANPQANIILNDFGQISNLTVRKRFFDLVKELKQRNTPISGLGIQAHEPNKGREWYPPKDLWETLDYLGSLGYRLHITEFIPQSSGEDITGNWRKGIWTLETQAEFAGQFYTLCFGHPSVVSINWWGFSDRTSFCPGRGLVTREYQPKPVYNRLKRLIHEEWKTKVNIRTDDEGMVKFRGFYGKYVINVKNKEGRVFSFNIHVRENEEDRWIFTLN